MKDQYDQIAEVDTIVEKSEDVEKFNPWHDARGRFTTAGGGGGRGSFSANPKTKAGQLAIQRAYNSGKHTTFNRHKESKGENVYQNYKWLNSRGGSFPGSRKPKGFTGTTSRNGLNARTNTRTYSKPPKNYLQGTGSSSNTSASKPKQQTTSKPAASQPKTTTTSKPKTTQSKPASSKPKQTNKPAAGAKKPSTQRKMVDGKDIRKTFRYDSNSKKSAVDQVAEQQGYKGKPKVVKNYNEFQQAMKASGVVMLRTINDGTDKTTGKNRKAGQFINDVKNANDITLNGSGGQAYGGGMYLAGNLTVKKGKMPNKKEQDTARSHTIRYGYGAGYSKTMAATLDPSAKVESWDKVYNEFKNLPSREKRKYDFDEGAYAAAKGYDAVVRDVGGGGAYYMVYNRSKMVIFDETYDAEVAGSSFNPNVNGIPIFW